MIRVGLIGYGYWGPNLLRNLRANPEIQVVALADRRRDRINDVGASDPRIQLFDDGEALIDGAELDAVVISTPVASHYSLTRAAIERGLHVLVEKPLAASVNEAADLVERAERRSVTLLVDHIFLFSSPVQMIRARIEGGELGSLSYFDSMRVNLGLFQPDVSVLWDLGVHDLSILTHLVDADPIHIEASGFCHVNPNIPDIAFLTLHYSRDFVAHLNLSWMSPVKVRRVALGGSRRMLVWNDLDQDEKIRIYDAGITVQPQSDRGVIIPAYRIGDIHVPRVKLAEPLSLLVEHFVDHIRTPRPSIIDGRQGLRVVRILEEADRRLGESLMAVEQRRGAQ